MSAGQINTPECRDFEARLTPLANHFFERYSMTPVGEVRYCGADPKAGGRLFLAFFRCDDFLLKIRAVDGVVDLLLGLIDAPLEWQDDGWFWPTQLTQMAVQRVPGTDELIALRDRLKDIGWV